MASHALVESVGFFRGGKMGWDALEDNAAPALIHAPETLAV